MCYVNFVRENMAFMEYARNEMLTANERLLWYALLHIMNRRANGSDWPEGFISVTNGEVLSYCPFGEDSLAASRNKLIQRGLIDYVKGERNKKAPQYKMCYFYPELSTGQSTENESYPKISGNIGGNTRGNTGGNSSGNDGGNARGSTGGIYINNNHNGIPIPKPCIERTLEEEVIRTSVSEGMLTFSKDRVQRAYSFTFLKPCPPELLDYIATVAAATKTIPLIQKAMDMAAGAGPDNIARYLAVLLQDWGSHGVHTQEELNEYLAKRDAEKLNEMLNSPVLTPMFALK